MAAKASSDNKPQKRRSATAKENKNVNAGKSTTHTRWLKDLRYGRSLSIEFFSYNAWLLVILLVAVLSLIGLRYKTKTKMAEIKSLTHKLELAESNKLREKAAYMSLVRETEMRRLVTEKNLGLIFQEQPPFEVEAAKN